MNFKKLFLKVEPIIINPIFYFFISILYLEILIKINTAKGLNINFIYPLLFGFSYAILFCFFSRIWKQNINKWIFGVLLGLICFYFIGQILYYDFFKVFLTLYSVGNGGQVAEFYSDIIQLIINNWYWIILCFIPLIGYVAYIRKVLFFKRLNDRKCLGYLGLFIGVYLVSYLLLYIPSSELNTPLDLYKEATIDENSVNQLGLLTSGRLDLKSLIFGKSDNLDETVVAETPETEVTYDPQTMNIDFEKLIADTNNKTIKSMHNYFKSVTPTSKNEYTGMFKDYNVILITAEGFSKYAIDKDLTPTLYRMYNEGFQFENFYTPLWGVSTSDGEYVAMQGLLPKSGTWSFRDSSSNSLPLTLGKQFSSMGYTTKAYHDHSYKYYGRDKSHPNLGYDYKGVGNGLKIKKQWPESDLEMMQKTVGEYINDEHFHTYYMTVSGHTNYTFVGNSMASKNRKLTAHLDASDLVKGYLATQIELDRALEYLIAQLEEKGIADKTVIALSADHYPYGLPEKNYNELAGKTLEKNFELYENAFLLWSGSMKESIKVEKTACSLDILPTLSNLLGLEYDSRLLMGTDILSDSDPLVIFANKSFITDKVMYNTSTNKATWINGATEDQEYLKNMNNIVKQKFKYSKEILENNYYKHVFSGS